MLIDALCNRLDKSGCLDGFWDVLDAGADASIGCPMSARAFLVAARFAHAPQCTLVVVAGDDCTLAFARQLSAYLGSENVLQFPARDDLPHSKRRPNIMSVTKRMQAAWALQQNKCVVVVASARALLRKLPPPDACAASPLVLCAGKELAQMPNASRPNVESLDALCHELEAMGFENTGNKLEGAGTFCTRGGTVDVFLGNTGFPVRLDFFGDELEEIRRIVPATGQTISSLEEIEIYPCVEFPISNKGIVRAKQQIAKQAKVNPALREIYEHIENASGALRFKERDVLLPYLYKQPKTLGAYTKKDVLSVLIEPKSIFSDMQHAQSELESKLSGTSIPYAGLFESATGVDFGGGQRATYVSLMRASQGELGCSLTVKRTNVAGSSEKLFDKLRGLLDAEFYVVFSVPNNKARASIKLDFVDAGLPIVDLGEAGKKMRLKRGAVNITDTDIPLGMVFVQAKLALVSINDMSGHAQGNTAKPIDITQITFPYKPGDYVVHAAHGIALFKALVRQEIDGSQRDYLHLEYAEGDKLFVPVEQLDRVTRYVGPEGAAPRLTRLNTADWSRALKKARRATSKLAFDLVDVYSRRASAKGHAFSCSESALQDMETSFPYQETPDQAAAIADVLADMRAEKPMDRLICGDVGFGKTEVALRAAFLAAMDNKQVMVLCPTTILAQQHFTSFSERLVPFGLKVEVLSRFRTNAQQKAALEGFAAGSIAVLIGTHRLLSRDVNPNDLGLVIIDEEQRFGVGHKEQFKNLRESVDVLTLSATPIPRTMQMSLSGVRDMSIILTPPTDRRPVKVHVGEWDIDVVSAAIRTELARGGQVYYVSNRVQSIDSAVKRVAQAAEEARVGVAHGQMGKEELERVMEDFSAGSLDVLVATTIIESGIDNPHTNTLIIEDAQHLGLAQMYQLKGRVGRSTRQAYAYFMFPEKVQLSEKAQARLCALNEHTDLGSGMRIAMRDLEIRGAGDILGAEQSGNLSSVGFDLFSQMLGEAVEKTRTGTATSSDAAPALPDVTLNLPGHTYFPNEYMPDVDERVLWYRKVACVPTVAAVDSLYESLIDEKQGAPQAVENLFDKARLKAFCIQHKIEVASCVAGKLRVEPISLEREATTKLRKQKGRYLPDKKKILIPIKNLDAQPDTSMFQVVYEFLSALLQ